MKRTLIYLAAGLLLVGGQSLMAQSTTNSPDSTAPAKHQLTQEQREERQHLMKLIGLTRADLKDLSPEDRRAKIKDAAKPVIDDLKAKKAAGTLTEEQKKDLAGLEKMIGHGHKKAAANTTTQ